MEFTSTLQMLLMIIKARVLSFISWLRKAVWWLNFTTYDNIIYILEETINI